MATKQEILNRIKSKNRMAGKKTILQDFTKTPPINPNDLDKMKKPDVYETYLIWLSIPALVKKMSEPTREDLGLLATEELKILTTIKSKDQFAKEFKVSRVTLHDWEAKPMTQKHLHYSKLWMHKLTSRILFSLAHTAMKSGKAPEVMAWMKIVEDYTEKMSLDHSGDVYVLDPDEKKRIKKLFEKNAHRRD